MAVRPSVVLLLLLAGAAPFACSGENVLQSCATPDCAEEEAEEGEVLQVSLLQVSLLQAGHHPSPAPAAPSHDRDLTLVHVPFNFGNTIAARAFSSNVAIGAAMSFLPHLTWDEVHNAATSQSEFWGPTNPDLRAQSSLNCPMYYTPGKHWPTDLAQRYFGNRTLFGVLRDPYERLIAIFRSGVMGHDVSPGSSAPEDDSYRAFHAACDANGAIKRRMREYIANENRYADGCRYLPQAEFYDMPYGITVPIDNRKFPQSANALLESHGYTGMHINLEHIIHITGCDDIWAGDLDEETKALVRQVYHRDFELICHHFGYCNDRENTCLKHVPTMCPPRLYEWSNATEEYAARAVPLQKRLGSFPGDGHGDHGFTTLDDGQGAGVTLR